MFLRSYIRDQIEGVSFTPAPDIDDRVLKLKPENGSAMERKSGRIFPKDGCTLYGTGIEIICD